MTISVFDTVENIHCDREIFSPLKLHFCTQNISKNRHMKYNIIFVTLVTPWPIPYLHQTSSVFRRLPLELNFNHMIKIAGIIYYTCSLDIDM